MRKFFILMFMAIPWLSQGQSLFNYTPTEIRQKWPNEEFTYDKWGDYKELLLMTFKRDNMGISYYFNASNKSVVTTVSPLTQGALQLLIEVYNKRYVIINNTTWKFYDDGNVYLCNLNQTDDGRYYFLWYVEE